MKTSCSSVLALAALVRLGLLPTCLAVAACFFPNGEVAQDMPCNASAAVGVCCGGYPNKMVCLDGGRCQENTGTIYRGTCTDQTWSSPECPQFCRKSPNALTHQCSSGADPSYCCDGDDPKCCDLSSISKFPLLPVVSQTIAVWNSVSSRYDPIIAQPVTNTGTTTTSSSTTSSSSSTSASTNTSPSTTSSTANSPTTTLATPGPSSTSAGNSASSVSDDGLSTGAKAGIGIGAAAGAILLAAVAYMAMRMRRMRQTFEAASAGAAAGQEGGRWAPQGSYVTEHHQHQHPSQQLLYGAGYAGAAYTDASVSATPKSAELPAHVVAGELAG